MAKRQLFFNHLYAKADVKVNKEKSINNCCLIELSRFYFRNNDAFLLSFRDLLQSVFQFSSFSRGPGKTVHTLFLSFITSFVVLRVWSYKKPYAMCRYLFDVNGWKSGVRKHPKKVSPQGKSIWSLSSYTKAF